MKFQGIALKNRNFAGKLLFLFGFALAIAIAYRIAISLLQSNLEFSALNDWRIICANVALFFLMYSCGLILVQIKCYPFMQLTFWCLLFFQSLAWFSTLSEFFGWVGGSALTLLVLHGLNFYWFRKQNMISPITLRNQARFRCYYYFDKNIRELPKNENGEFLEDATFIDSDIDAFRHACVSGIFAMKFGHRPALFFGWLHEFFFPSGGAAGKAMDVWNNEKGREAAKRFKSEKSLFKRLKKMLEDGVLATSPNDPRLGNFSIESNPIPHAGQFIRLGTAKKGQVVTYFELSSQALFTRKKLVSLIKAGEFPEYRLRKLGQRYYPVAKSDGTSANNLG